MVIYIDRLVFRSCLKIIRMAGRDPSRRNHVVRILDPLPGRLKIGVIRSVLAFKGFSIEEVQFHSGRLKTSLGQPVPIQANRIANSTSLDLARRLVKQSTFLTKLNQEWKKDTLILFIAKSLCGPIKEMLLRILVADALARQNNEENAVLVISRPAFISLRFLNIPNLIITVHYYDAGFVEKVTNRLKSFFWLGRQLGREIVWKIGRIIQGRPKDTLSPGEPSSLLLFQEQDISMDRSYRTQPHWLFPEDNPPTFRTIIIQTGARDQRYEINLSSLKDDLILPVSPAEWCVYRRSHPSHPVEGRLRRDLFKCLVRLFFSSSNEVKGISCIYPLFYFSRRLAGFCIRKNVKAFMASENYMIYTDAMQIISPWLNIRTISFQYSNTAQVSTPMLTTADDMITFSDFYHSQYVRNGIRPGRFINGGYIFDGAVRLIRERALALRTHLHETGARFIICYFDENSFNHKYGFVSVQDHVAYLEGLLRLVLDDPTIGLIIKIQFQKNSPKNFPQLTSIRTAAEATGRYVELSKGSLRNNIFPAEGALAADMVIGHKIGATASLEASLTGVRSIMLNQNGIMNDNDYLYDQADIIYSSMTEALQAIDEYRKGSTGRARLGEWSSILHHFDPFRDENSGKRMRNCLDRVMNGDGELADVTIPEMSGCPDTSG